MKDDENLHLRNPDDKSKITATQLLTEVTNLQEEIARGVGNAEQQQESMFQFLVTQLTAADRYKHIFMTSRGSVYFVTEQDQSFRVKFFNRESFDQTGMGYYIRSDHISQKIIFVDNEQSKIVGRVAYTPPLLAILPITTIPFGVGAHPIEIGLLTSTPLGFQQQDNIFTIGRLNSSETYGIHRGHPIIEANPTQILHNMQKARARNI